MFPRISNDPLLYWLAVGVLIYALPMMTRDARPETIVVSEDNLIRYLRSRNPILTLDDATHRLATLSRPAREELIEDYVQREVLLREARSMGLDEDHAIQEQLLARLENVYLTMAEDHPQVSHGMLLDHYEAFSADYMRPETLTFSHIYFADASTDELEALLTVLRQSDTGADAGARHGDTFLFEKAYTTVSQDTVSSLFGDNFAIELFNLHRSSSWQGPISSSYGKHLVWITERVAPYLPEFDAVSTRVRLDLYARMTNDRVQMFKQSARERYAVHVQESD